MRFRDHLGDEREPLDLRLQAQGLPLPQDVRGGLLQPR